MAREPQFPTDAPIENSTGVEGSEALREAAAAAGDRKRRKQYLTAGVAVGVGSAAIVAALLYSSRRPRKD